MNSIWNKNYALFKKRFPQLAEMLPAPENPEKLAESLWETARSKAGALTASEGGVRLHSAYNPEREAAGAVAGAGLENKSTVVFYGFGLGYHVIECARKFPDKKIVLIEPDAGHFFAALTLLDWEDVFKVEKLVIAVGCPENQIIHLIEDTSKVGFSQDELAFFDIAPFTAHAAAYFENIRTIIKRNKRRNEINAATLKKFGKLWCRNSLRNVTQLAECGSVMGCVGAAGLAGATAGRSDTEDVLPFLICGAGPSLENILPQLKEISHKAVIVCVETSLHALQRAGVEPDFILLTDPQFWAYRHIAGLSAPKSILITEVSTYPAVFRFPCSKILLCKSQFPIGNWFEEEFSLELGDLGTGGSVASCAWNFAHLCGAREIYTAGLDFAFPGGQTHIKGSSAEQSWHTASNRLAGAEKAVSATIHSANIQKADDNTGGLVLTDSRMKMFAWWFEARLAACPETKTYTLCPGGLKVPGINPAPLSQLLEKENITEKKAAFIKQAKKTKPCLPQAQKARLEKLLENFPPPEFLAKYGFLGEYL